MLNRVITTESDGALNIQPSLSGLPLAVVGQSTAGDLNKPTPLTDPAQAQSTFGLGRAVEATCYALNRLGIQVVHVRTATSVAADYGTVDDSAEEGSSVVSVTSDGTQKPNDDYEIVVTFKTADGDPVTIGA